MIGPSEAGRLEAYLREHEVFLNSLGSRMTDPSDGGSLDLGKALQGLRPAWTLATRDFEAILAIHQQGFAAVHARDPAMISSDYQQIIKALRGRIGHMRTLMGESDTVEAFLGQAFQAPEAHIRYLMLYRDNPAASICLAERFSGDARFMRSSSADLPQLLPLQLAYEMEEVLLRGHKLHQGLTRFHLSRALEQQLAVHGTYRGQIVTKAMTNARGFRYDQIGGVYTLPEFRGMGFAKEAMSFLLEEIRAQGKAANLFVKVQNHAALKLYQRLDFKTAGPFSIVYWR